MTHILRNSVLFVVLPALLASAAGAHTIEWLAPGANNFELTAGQTSATANNICTATPVTAEFANDSGLATSPFPRTSSSIQGPAIGLDLVSTPVLGASLVLDFGVGNEVENFTISLHDVDQVDDSGSAWTDRVIVTATYAGTPTAVSFGCSTSPCVWQEVAPGTIDGDFDNPTFADSPGQAVVTIPGPVDRIAFDYWGTGPGTALQYVGFGQIDYSCSATPSLDVELRAVVDAAGRRRLEVEASRTAGVVAMDVEREQGGLFVPVGSAAMFDASANGRARVALRGDVATLLGVYRVVEVDARGRRKAHGPFVVDQFVRESAEERSERVVSSSVSAEAAPKGGRAIAFTRHEGIASVALAEIGLPAGISEVALSEDGRAVPHRVEGKRVYWWASEYRDAWNDTNAYRVAPASGAAMSVQPSRASGATAAHAARLTQRFEVDVIPALATTTETGRDYWHWAGLLASADHSPRVELPLELAARPLADDARLTVVLAAGSRGPGRSTHRARVALNGEELGVVEWSDYGERQAVFEVPSGVLARESTLAVQAELVEGADQSLFFIDRAVLDYLGEPEAEAGRARFVATAGATRVIGFSSPAVVAMRRTGGRTLWVSAGDLAVREHAGGYAVELATTPGDVYALAEVSATAPVGLRSPSSGLPSLDGKVDLVIVAPEPFVDAAERYARQRSAAGVEAVVVRELELYDAYSGGRTDPWAVRGLLADARSSVAEPLPSVLLLGKGTYDPLDRTGAGDHALPVPWVGTSFGLFAADSRLGDVDGDGVPEALVARLPITDGESLDAYAEKVARTPTSGDALFVADDPDSAGHFPLQAELIREGLDGPSRLIAHEANSGDLLRLELLDAWRHAPSLIAYVGHGASTHLAEERFLETADVEALGGTTPLFAALSCAVNRHELAGHRSLGESLVLAPESGSLVSFAPSGMSYSDPATLLGVELTAALDSVDRVGDGLLKALARFGPRDFGSIGALYSVLGDPTIRFDHPGSGSRSPSRVPREAACSECRERKSDHGTREVLEDSIDE